MKILEMAFTHSCLEELGNCNSKMRSTIHSRIGFAFSKQITSATSLETLHFASSKKIISAKSLETLQSLGYWKPHAKFILLSFARM
jgi:hypothetical protein